MTTHPVDALAEVLRSIGIEPDPEKVAAFREAVDAPDAPEVVSVTCSGPPRVAEIVLADGTSYRVNGADAAFLAKAQPKDVRIVGSYLVRVYRIEEKRRRAR